MIDLSHVQAGTSHFGVLALILAFVAGIAAALGPTSYALAPAVIGYGVNALSDRGTSRARAFSAVVGILAVSAVTGATAGSLGNAAVTWFGRNVVALYAIGALIFAILGLRFVGLLMFRLPPTPAPAVRRVPTIIEAFGVGGALAIAACPACTPLLLAVVLGAAAIGNPLAGAIVLIAFGLGRAIPIVALALSSTWFRGLRILRPYARWFERFGGMLLLGSAAYFAYAAWASWAALSGSGTSTMPGM